MSKSTYDVASALSLTNPVEQNYSQVPPDPLVQTRIRVTLDNVVPCTHNPRKTRNPKFDEIKESIRNRGLDEPPQVTRQFPTDPYMVKRGGNTRLEILNELWNETQDPKFYSFDCMFVPWPKEGNLELLIGSAVENELRGDMLFIERAIAAFDAKQMFEERDQTTYTTNALSKLLREWGWSIDQSNLGQLLYAHEVLFPVIPNTFWNGLGRPAVKALRKILDTSRTFFESVATPEDGTFDEIWKVTFAAIDGDLFEVGVAQDNLEADIATRLNCPIGSVRGEIQGIATGISKGGHRPEYLIPENPDPALAFSPISPKKPTTTKSKTNTQNNTPQKQQSDQPPAATNDDLDTDDKPSFNPLVDEYSSVTNGTFVADHRLINLCDGIGPKFEHLKFYSTKDLQDLAFEKAIEFAAAHGFADLVDLASSYGLGNLTQFHSGFVMLPENPNQPLSIQDRYAYLTLYHHASGFLSNHNDQRYACISHHVPQGFMGDDYWNITQAMSHYRSMIQAAYLLGDPLGDGFHALLELEVALGIIFYRAIGA